MAQNFSVARERIEPRPGGRQPTEVARARLAAELIAYEAGRDEMHGAWGRARAQLMSERDLDEAALGRIESEALMYLSTMRSHLEAVGGELDLVATFGDGTRVALAWEELVAEG